MSTCNHFNEYFIYVLPSGCATLPEANTVGLGERTRLPACDFPEVHKVNFIPEQVDLSVAVHVLPA